LSSANPAGDNTAQLQEASHQAALNALANSLDDREVDVRRVATAAVARVAAAMAGDFRDCPHAVCDLILRSLSDVHPDVRRTAINSLAEVSGWNNEPLAESVAARLADSDIGVRLAAVDTLSKAAGPDALRMQRAVQRQVDSKDAEVRRLAVKTLGDMLQMCGSLSGLPQAVLRSTRDRSPDVSRAAVGGIVKFVRKSGGASSIAGCLRSMDAKTRLMVLQALYQFSDEADADIIRSVADHVGDDGNPWNRV
jgi:HEAT repeat protein